MDEITFDTLSTAWSRMVQDQNKVDAMQAQAPGFENPTAIRLKNLGDHDGFIKIKFLGFDAAVKDSQHIPGTKRMIKNWINEFASEIRVIDSLSSDLTLLISKSPMITEASIPVYRRDPKTNKVKRAYKCIGGRKDGRRVSDPDQCLQYPDVAKKMSLSVTRRAKYGQSSKSRTKTRLTNIVSRRVRKANARLKKARGI